MTFTEEQIALLGAPLSSANVKTRRQAGRTLSYLEGWVAIAEANRIFGFGEWKRETVYCKEVCRYEVTIGTANKPGWKVGYEAMVRVTMGAVVREGTGHGNGTMTDLFDCIESAAKEAETDAMKRAMMTLGNAFGLALYDKEQRNVSRDGGVSDEADQRMGDNINAYTKKVGETVDGIDGLPRNEQEWKDWGVTFKTVVDSCTTAGQIEACEKGAKGTLDALLKASPSYHANIMDHVQGRREILETPTGNTVLGAG